MRERLGLENERREENKTETNGESFIMCAYIRYIVISKQETDI